MGELAFGLHFVKETKSEYLINTFAHKTEKHHWKEPKKQYLFQIFQTQNDFLQNSAYILTSLKQ